jgi:hypothetical protein
LKGLRGGSGKKGKTAGKQSGNFRPDRRAHGRTASAAPHQHMNEFDGVFGVPDVSDEFAV